MPIGPSRGFQAPPARFRFSGSDMDPEQAELIRRSMEDTGEPSHAGVEMRWTGSGWVCDGNHPKVGTTCDVTVTPA